MPDRAFCPGCGERVRAYHLPEVLLDAASRHWHSSCARKALAGGTAAEERAACAAAVDQTRRELGVTGPSRTEGALLLAAAAIRRRGDA